MTSTTPTPTPSTCQVCGREIKLKARGYLAGTIADHGYKRPGYGHHVGGCPGERCVPYEVGHEALQGWIKDLNKTWRALGEEREEVVAGRCRVFEEKYDRSTGRWTQTEVPRSHYSWERLRRSQEWRLRRQIERLGEEIYEQNRRLRRCPSYRRQNGLD